LVKLFNHFESFQKTCHSANLKPDIIKVDAISILSALAPLMDYSLDQLISSQPDQSSKDRLSSSWKSVIIETLRRLECVSAPGSPIFGNLQEWILDCLRSIKSYQSSRPSATSRLETSADINYQPWATPAAEVTWGDNIRYMTLPNIPAAGPSGYTVDSPPTQSHDLQAHRMIVHGIRLKTAPLRPSSADIAPRLVAELQFLLLQAALVLPREGIVGMKALDHLQSLHYTPRPLVTPHLFRLEFPRRVT